MRNSLIHEMKNIEDFSKFIYDNLEDYGKRAINQVYELCFEERYDLYSEIIEFLDEFEMTDVEESNTDNLSSELEKIKGFGEN